jgi:RimJ/RimL family protein N-acetyltransferase
MARTGKSEMEPVYLRYLELDDLDRTHKWHNDPELYALLTGPFNYVSKVLEEQWLRNKQASYSLEVNLAICLAGNSRHIGNISLRNIDWIARHAELHIFIGEPDQRLKGYGQAAVRLLIRHATQDMGLQRLHLLVLADNKPAITVYEKCGFVIEGKLRRHVFKGSKFRDTFFMGYCTPDVLPDEA